MIKYEFRRVSANDEGSLEGRLVQQVIFERPELKRRVFCAPKQGCNGVVVICGDEVFKGVKRASQEDPAFYREADHIQGLHDYNLPIPRVTCMGSLSFFFGMTRVKGVTLRDLNIYGLSITKEKFVQDMAKYIVNFDRAVEHAVSHGKIQLSIENAPMVYVPETEFSEAMSAPVVRKLLGKKINVCREISAAFIERPMPLMYVHPDLNSGNILIDPSSGGLAGVVDLAFITQAQALRAVSSLRLVFGDEFCNRILAELAGKTEKYTKEMHHAYLMTHTIIRLHRWADKDYVLKSVDALLKKAESPVVLKRRSHGL